MDKYLKANYLYLSFHSFPTTHVLVRKKWHCAIFWDDGEHFKILKGGKKI